MIEVFWYGRSRLREGHKIRNCLVTKLGSGGLEIESYFIKFLSPIWAIFFPLKNSKYYCQNNWWWGDGDPCVSEGIEPFYKLTIPHPPRNWKFPNNFPLYPSLALLNTYLQWASTSRLKCLDWSSVGSSQSGWVGRSVWSWSVACKFWLRFPSISPPPTSPSW